MRFGYNTNGFAHHRLEDAIDVLGKLGYRSVAITLDHYALNPFDIDMTDREVRTVRSLLETYDMHCVVETGARFLLNSYRKHQPTLVTRDEAERQRRLFFLTRAIHIAADLRADAVSFWSGAHVEKESDEILWERLTDGCHQLSETARHHQVRVAFEPEPGMFIDTMEKFAELHRRVDHSRFGLTLDVGHVHCMDDGPIAEHIHEWNDWLWNVHIEDMRRGIHDHLFFGEGEMDFPPILAALKEIGYDGGIHVELSRHSHDAVNTARNALKFLRGYL